MKKFSEYRLNENLDDQSFRNIYYMFSSIEDIEFLKSLNLTSDQHSKLAYMISEYGQEKYDDGCSSEYNNEY
jgi:hypothetical protein